ncbi:hypothetical protein [Hymenobacter sp. CRA2]|nr:hypothetical protein [Hymenobacter sp. CRA2]
MEQLLSTRSVLGVLGFLVLVLLVSIGVIASQLGGEDPVSTAADTAYLN